MAKGRRAAVAAAGVVLVLLGATACGSEPTPAPPSGVDELVVPTPSPDPADFGSDVDNAWWPLPADATWTYRDDQGRELVRTVLPEPRQVGGIQATGVTVAPVASTWPAGTAPAPVTAWYGQDRRRNVWLVGATRADGTVWEAGADDVPAGLVVTGRPRVGDGYVRVEVPDVASQRVRVLEVGAEATVDGVADEVVTLEVTTAGTPDRVEEQELARGTGLVRWTDGRTEWTYVAP